MSNPYCSCEPTRVRVGAAADAASGGDEREGWWEAHGRHVAAAEHKRPRIVDDCFFRAVLEVCVVGGAAIQLTLPPWFDQTVHSMKAEGSTKAEGSMKAEGAA